ncbi:MAG: DUF362 domain-containing protein [Deltaproteobacteria bacterium]|nr:DUF362 domain-containing protein [Deltaproteobacteria bacterium]
MSNVLYQKSDGSVDSQLLALQRLLSQLHKPFAGGTDVGIKLHWGEAGNTSFLPPAFAREIAHWLMEDGFKPFVFDTTVLYSGKRRTGQDTLATAAAHGYTETYLGCPVMVGDGMDGRDVVDIPSGHKHFKTIQVASLIEKAGGFVIFSHFKGHLASGFGGAIKNLSMGFGSRAQKQRMHADVRPKLRQDKCTRCGLCIEVCPAGAAQSGDDGYPTYDLEICLGCAQCIACCPELALKILFGAKPLDFQEKITETAAGVWKRIQNRSVLINALVNITCECDCFPGDNPVIHDDAGFLGGYHPVTVDAESLKIIGTEPFDKAHPNTPWQRQFDYAGEIGF